MEKSKTLGVWGEDLTAAFLEKKGCRIIGRNYRCPYGEIDLIAESEGFLLFVEVKLRKSAHFAPAAEFVDRRKQEKLKITAQYWLMEHDTLLQPRFDVVEVYAPYGMETAHPDIRHLEEAFW